MQLLLWFCSRLYRPAAMPTPTPQKRILRLKSSISGTSSPPPRQRSRPDGSATCSYDHRIAGRRHAPDSRFDYRPASRWRQSGPDSIWRFRWGGEVCPRHACSIAWMLSSRTASTEALRAVKQARFEPAQNDGKNVPAEFTYVYRFRLRNRQGLR